MPPPNSQLRAEPVPLRSLSSAACLKLAITAVSPERKVTSGENILLSISGTSIALPPDSLRRMFTRSERLTESDSSSVLLSGYTIGIAHMLKPVVTVPGVNDDWEKPPFPPVMVLADCAMHPVWCATCIGAGVRLRATTLGSVSTRTRPCVAKALMSAWLPLQFELPDRMLIAPLTAPLVAV